MPHILVVEDERALLRLLTLELTHEQFIVHQASSLEAALATAPTQIDLIVLDIGLPGLDGLQGISPLKERFACPIVLLTARGELEIKIEGFARGADDYLTKPFAFPELLARIRARLRPREPSRHLLRYADVQLDLDAYTAQRAGRPMELTKREFDLLRYFLENRHVVLSRERILQQVWGFDFEGESNVVDVYVARLRQRLEGQDEPPLLQTVRGVGYVLRPAESR